MTPDQLEATLVVTEVPLAAARKVELRNKPHNPLWPEEQYSGSVLNKPAQRWERKEVSDLYRAVGSGPLVAAHNALLMLYKQALKQLRQAHALVQEEREKAIEVERAQRSYTLKLCNKIRHLKKA